MNTLKLILRNLSHYRVKNLTVIAGIAISSAVLTGAMMVGDSVASSLKRIVNLRLGKVEITLTTGERFVTSGLAANLQNEIGTSVSPVLMLEGIAVAEGGQKRVNNIQVLGVDSIFDSVTGIQPFFHDLSENEVIISKNMAERLGVQMGDEVLFRITRASLIPLNAPFVSDEDPVVSVRLKIKAIAGDEQLGRFNLRISQKSPYNAFVSIGFLNRLMDFDNKANVLLFSGNSSLSEESILSAIQKKWSLEDAGLILRKTAISDEVELLSERVFLDEPVLKALENVPGNKNYILTYFVNNLTSNEKSTPYSFVSTLPDSVLNQNEIVINQWLAEDLGIVGGDSIRINYYTVGPLRRLIEKEAFFVVKEVVPIKGYFADENLMPVIPGLTDAGNCRDWETGVPIKLENIRDKDEKYWEVYKGTPKAFIAQTRAEKIWTNTFGSYTAVRFSLNGTHSGTMIQSVISRIDPSTLGFKVNSVLGKSLDAAAQGVDFSQLFIGLSFFVLLAAVILTVLLLILNLEGRREQIETLSALGIPHKTIRKVMYTESLVLSILGSFLGIVFAVLYTSLVFKALNGIWMDIVRTDMMEMIITFPGLAKGFIFSLIIACITLFITIRNFLSPKHDRSRLKLQEGKRLIRGKIMYVTALLAGVFSLALILSQILRRENINAGIFFLAGGLMLLSILLMLNHYLNRIKQRKYTRMNFLSLSFINMLRNKSRSTSIVILLAIGTFIVISTGVNRKDLFVNASDRSSGTGGFLLFAESTVPVVRDLQDVKVREELGLSIDYNIIQLSKADGDDASCLNLNRIANPRILGADPQEFSGRFSFVSGTSLLNVETPWLSLDQDIPGDLIPAIADQTVIKWGLGKKAGDTLSYTDNFGDTIKLLLIGGLANSVFQGNVIISKNRFHQHFPDKGGSNVFLIDGDAENSSQIEDDFRSVFRDYGMETEFTARKLAEFNSVENTYLSIFMVMGALALLIGTVGLGLILARSILERRKEIALLKAVGIGRQKILNLIINEYFILLLSGILVGVITSSLATLPSLINPNSGISFNTIMFITGILLLNGILWIILLAWAYLKDPAISQALRNE